MARPSKATVDYFPHDTNHGKTLYILEQLYGNDGYALWFKLLEQLGNSEHHYFDIQDINEFEFFIAKCKMSKEKALEIINKLADLGAIDKELFEQGIVLSDKFLENVKDAYNKRTSIFWDKNSILLHLSTSKRVFSPENRVFSPENPQSKVKENKGEEIEKTDFIKIHPEQSFQNNFLEQYNTYFKKVYRLSQDEKTTLCHITNTEQYTLDDWTLILKNASKGWIIEGESVKPSLSNILKNHTRFLNDDYNLDKGEEKTNFKKGLTNNDIERIFKDE